MSAQLASVEHARRLSVDQYQRERDEIRATYGDSNTEAHAKRDQALAALFHRSGWTQEELAKVEGVARQHVARKLAFGAFLSFAPTGSIPRNLTERRFRGYWERTDKNEGNERVRFRAVLALIEHDTRIGKPTAKKPKVADAILSKFADGKWHKLPTIVDHTECEPEDVESVLDGMISRGTYGVHCERKQVGKTQAYRIVRNSGKTVSMGLLIEELEPLLKQLDAEGQKNMATMSPGTVARLAHELRTALERLAK